jgi:hypothetical protein
MNDLGNEMCGISIDVIPTYSTLDVKEQCRSLLWDKDEISDKFKRVLEDAGSQHMNSLISFRFTSPDDVEVSSEAWGYEDDDDDGTPIEAFFLEINFYGDESIEEEIAEIVLDDATDIAVCKYIKSKVEGYISGILPEAKLKWKIEVESWSQP